MEAVLKELLNHWEIVAAILAAIWTIHTYSNAQKESRSWSRTRILLEQANIFETDPQICSAVLILEGRHPDIKVETLFSSSGEPNNERYGKEIQAFDRMLNFLQRLGYASIALESLSKEELELFGWYYSRILEESRLSKYCDKYGFPCVIEFAGKI